MKKAVEINKMCGIDVFMVMFDRNNQKFTEFSTDPKFDSNVVQYLLSDLNRLQFDFKKFTNDDYLSFCNDKSKEYIADDKSEQGTHQNNVGKAESFEEILNRYIRPESQATKHQKRYKKQLEKEMLKIK